MARPRAPHRVRPQPGGRPPCRRHDERLSAGRSAPVSSSPARLGWSRAACSLARAWRPDRRASRGRRRRSPGPTATARPTAIAGGSPPPSGVTAVLVGAGDIAFVPVGPRRADGEAGRVGPRDRLHGRGQRLPGRLRGPVREVLRPVVGPFPRSHPAGARQPRRPDRRRKPVLRLFRDRRRTGPGGLVLVRGRDLARHRPRTRTA